MNHGGSDTHNRGMTLRRWNAVNGTPPSWVPSILFWNNFNQGYFAPSAWYSDFEEFMTSGFVTLTGTVDSGIEISNFTLVIKDTWYTLYTAFYNQGAASGGFTTCGGTFNQYLRREGTITRVTFNRLTGTTTTDVFDQTFPLVSGPNGIEWGYWGAAPSAGGQEAPLINGVQGCFAHTAVSICQPSFYAKGYLIQPPGTGPAPEFSTIFSTVPQYVFNPALIGPIFQWVDGSYRQEPNAICAGNFNSQPLHSPYLEVMDAAGTPFNFPWVPPS